MYDRRVSQDTHRHAPPVDPTLTLPSTSLPSGKPELPARKETLTALAGGRYVLIDRLGEGGMATVWRAIDASTRAEVAVKLLHPGISERISYRSRFLAEARTMARIRHPNVLRVHEVGDENGRYWFTMEIVDGGALIDTLERQGKVAMLTALDWAFQLLQALSAAHLEGVVHRDVKPDNILVDQNGRIRLCDFGIARIRSEQVEHRTRTGVAMGTAGYMAPEQRENARDVGAPADIYAVGATLYALITGCEPPDLFASHVDPTLLRGLPPAVRDAIAQSTAYRPERRYANARAMATDIAAAYDTIARGEGKPERGAVWLARFDDLLVQDRPWLREDEPLTDVFSLEGDPAIESTPLPAPTVVRRNWAPTLFVATAIAMALAGAVAIATALQ
jgi:serine/threonine protein kinase